MPVPAPRNESQSVRLDYELSSLLDFVPVSARQESRYAAAAIAAAEPFRGAEAASEAATNCLAAAVYYEARSQSVDGQRAVAQVVLNRVRHAAFPKTICGVVFQGSQRRTGCQFSFTCDGSMNRRRDPHAWQQAQAVANEALRGHVAGQVGLATHYHTHAVNPVWARSLRTLTSVESHVFYSWRGAAGDPRAFRNPLGQLTSSPPRPVRRAANQKAPTPAPIAVADDPVDAMVRAPKPQAAANPGFGLLAETYSDQPEAAAPVAEETNPSSVRSEPLPSRAQAR